MGKMSTLTKFLLEPGCEDYFLLTKQLKTLSMALILSSQTVDTQELDVSFDEADAMPSWVSSGFLCLVSAHFDHL